MKTLILAGLATFAMLATSMPAQAAIVTSVPASTPTVFNGPQGDRTTFNGLATAGTAGTFATIVGGAALQTGFTLTLAGAQIVSGSVNGAYAQPFTSDGSNYLSVYTGRSATLTSAVGFQTISFFLGSIDPTNRFEILDFNGFVIDTITGLEIGNATGNQTQANSNRRVTFTRDAAANEYVFYGLRVLSGQNSAELDNIAFITAVPETSTWLMMILGFGMIGSSLRERNRAKKLFA